MPPTVDSVGRRDFWRRRTGRVSVTVAVAVTLVASTGSAAGAPTRAYAGFDYVSRPDLHPPVVDINVPANGVEPGNTFVTPASAVALEGGPAPASPVQAGPMIMDDAGQPVWFAPAKRGVATDLDIQQYQGKPVLTWWEGDPVYPPGIGRGRWMIADDSYKTIAVVNAGNGYDADLHDFTITPQNTGLVLSERTIPRDLSGIGGPKNGQVIEGVVQEVDIATGKVLFEWHSGDHVGPEDSFEPVVNDPKVVYNYFHVNAVSLDTDGNLLISARNTHTVYQVDRKTGAINWRLGGKKNDFAMGPSAAFSWQHDVRRQPDGTITVFDNANGAPKSRAIRLRVDEAKHTASLVDEHPSPDNEASPHQGSIQPLPNGDVFVGWGGKPRFTEFGPDGKVKFHGTFRDNVTSYRAFRFPWVGHPANAPAIVGKSTSDTKTSVYTSWNGDNQVRTWRVLAGPDQEHLAPVKDTARTGFETRIDLDTRQTYVQAQGLDSQGHVIGTSGAVLVTT